MGRASGDYVGRIAVLYLDLERLGNAPPGDPSVRAASVRRLMLGLKSAGSVGAILKRSG